MCLSALHVDRDEPASSQDTSNAAGVVLIGLVPHRRQGRANLASFHADDIKAIVRKPIEQMLAHAASLKPDPRNRVSEALQTLGDFTDIAGQFALKGNATPSHPQCTARTIAATHPVRQYTPSSFSLVYRHSVNKGERPQFRISPITHALGRTNWLGREPPHEY